MERGGLLSEGDCTSVTAYNAHVRGGFRSASARDDRSQEQINETAMLRQKIAEQQHELDQRASYITGLQRNINSLSAAAKGDKKQIARLEEIIDDGKSQIAQLEENLELINELSEHTAEIASDSPSKSMQEARIHDLEVQIQGLEKHNKSLNSELAESHKRVASLISELDFVNKQGVRFTERMLSEKRTLENKLELEQKQQQTMLQQFGEYQKQVSLQMQASNAAGQVGGIVASADSHSTNINESTPAAGQAPSLHISVVPGSDQELRESLKAAQSRILELQERLVEEQHRMVQAVGEKSQMEVQRSRLMQEFSRVQGREMRLEVNMSQETQRANALAARVQSLEEKLQELQEHGNTQIALGAFTAFVKPGIGSRQYPHSKKVVYKPQQPAGGAQGARGRHRVERLKLVSTNKIAKIF